MNVSVRHGLSCRFAGVDADSDSVYVGLSFKLKESLPEEAGDGVPFVVVELGNSLYVSHGNDQHVAGGNGVGVG
jgi:hypothetical protein